MVWVNLVADTLLKNNTEEHGERYMIPNPKVRVWLNGKSHYILIVYDTFGLTSRYATNGSWKEIKHFDEP